LSAVPKYPDSKDQFHLESEVTISSGASLVTARSALTCWITQARISHSGFSHKEDKLRVLPFSEARVTLSVSFRFPEPVLVLPNV